MVLLFGRQVVRTARNTWLAPSYAAELSKIQLPTAAAKAKDQNGHGEKHAQHHTTD